MSVTVQRSVPKKRRECSIEPAKAQIVRALRGFVAFLSDSSEVDFGRLLGVASRLRVCQFEFL